MYDIIIIGAGVSGCACARELSRYDAKILVVEKEEDVCCGTSKANSAIVHAGYDAAHGSLMAKLNVEGSRRMPALAKELDFAYDRCGSLVVCLSDEDRPTLQKLYENGIANGVEGLRIIERDELVGMEPNISDAAVAALWAPTGGIVCPFGLTFALAENAPKTVCSFGLTPKLRACTRWTAAEPGGPSRPTTARWKRAASSMRRAYTPTRCTIWPTRRTP